MVDVCEAAAHELAAVHMAGKRVGWPTLAFRRLIGDPSDLTRRSIAPSINTLTVRRDDRGGSFLLHDRNSSRVAVAGGMYHLIPAGMFQPSSVSPLDHVNDFDLWRNVMREYSEELLGNPEHDGSGRRQPRHVSSSRGATATRSCPRSLPRHARAGDRSRRLRWTCRRLPVGRGRPRRDRRDPAFSIRTPSPCADSRCRRSRLGWDHACDRRVRAEGVCHLAALTRVRDSFQQPTRYFAVNVTGTLNVLRALEQLAERTGRVPRIVFASTVAVYGLASEQPIAEDAPPLPTTPYGASKLAADHAIGFQAATGVLAAVSLRCFNVAGATPQTLDTDLTRVIPKALAVAAGREPYLVMNGDGSSVRDYLHVADLADAYALALDAAEPGRHAIYNTGSALPVSLRGVIDSVERITGRRLDIRPNPPQNEPSALLADHSQIRRALAWEPHRSQLDAIVRDAWEAVERT